MNVIVFARESDDPQFVLSTDRVMAEADKLEISSRVFFSFLFFFLLLFAITKGVRMRALFLSIISNYK